jgi:nucleoid-associated protein YejK
MKKLEDSINRELDIADAANQYKTKMFKFEYTITEQDLADIIDMEVMDQVNEGFFKKLEKDWEDQCDAYFKSALFGTCAKPVEGGEPLTLEKLMELLKEIEEKYPYETYQARKKRELEAMWPMPKWSPIDWSKQ